MKKFVISVVLVGASALYIFMRTPAAAAVAPVVPTSPSATAANSAAGAPAAPTGTVPPPLPTPSPTKAQPAPTPMQQHMTAMMSGYKDGSYTGSVADAFYGYVQVKATISGGKITDVAFLSYPDSHDTSRYINSQAMPMLTQEAIAAQSANVDLIGGATDTSLAFKQSLTSALAKAQG